MKRTVKEMHCSVVKRNGTVVPFHKERIEHAIEFAFRDTKKVPQEDPIDPQIKKIVEEMTDCVVSQAYESAEQGACLTVEGIQDMVEMTLMKNGHHDVARDYILYRDSRKTKRDNQLNLKVYRRGKSMPVRFNPMKIASSIEWAFRHARKMQNQTPDGAIAIVNRITHKIVEEMIDLSAKGDQLFIDMIEDRIERELMSEKIFDVAKSYIIYRSEKSKSIELPPMLSAEESACVRQFQVASDDGALRTLKDTELREKISFACRNLPSTSIETILDGAIAQMNDGMSESSIDQLLISSAASQADPVYSEVAAKLLLDVIYQQTLGVSASDPKLQKKHREYLKKYLKESITLEWISPELLDFDLDKISQAMDLSRDHLLTYTALQTLFNSYLMQHQERRLETPQIFWMRIAMGLAIHEKDKTARAIEFYDVLSQLLFICSSPILFNAGTLHPQLSSCYVTSVMDDLPHIFKNLSDCAQISKWSGGIGSDWTYIRAAGSPIKSTHGIAQGITPFLKMMSDTATTVSQGNKRKGAQCAYLETWHLDIESFLDLRKTNSDRRSIDIHTAHWIPDLFMKRVKENGTWTLFSPTDVPDLHDLYGSSFEKRYIEYEKKASDGQIKLYKRVDAMQLWRKMLTMIFECGHPWLAFKDPANIVSPQNHVGRIHNAGLCTEILLNSSPQEPSACNLGSVNLALHTTTNGLNEPRIAATVRSAVRMLDNAIDINCYPTPESKNSALAHRPIGIGIMGFQEALYVQNISYASHAAVEFSDQSMETISYYALSASSDLAKERGGYASFDGSKWNKGWLPIDAVEELEIERQQKIDVNRSYHQNWKQIRDTIKNQKLRNCSLLAIAPTAAIAQIAGVTPSIDPARKHFSTESNSSHEWTSVNRFLAERLKSLNLWDGEMIDDLKYFEGTIREIARIPADCKTLFSTCFEIEPEWLIECAARRQKWVDMGQSLTIFLSDPSFKKLHHTYMLAWEKGLKATYHLRIQGPTQTPPHKQYIN